MIWHTLALLLGAFLVLLGICGMAYMRRERIFARQRAPQAKPKSGAEFFITGTITLSGGFLMFLAWMGMQA